MIYELTEALKGFVEETLSELYQSRPDGEWSTPAVYIGALPPKGEDQFPFVVIRPSNGSDSGEDRSTVGVVMVIGAHTPKDSPEAITAGFQEVLNILTRLRQAFLENRILAGRFELDFPLTWRTGGENENQPHPQYVAAITTNWIIPAMQRIDLVTEE